MNVIMNVEIKREESCCFTLIICTGLFFYISLLKSYYFFKCSVFANAKIKFSEESRGEWFAVKYYFYFIFET